MLITEIKSKDKIDKYNVDVLILPTKFSSTSDFIVDINQLQLFANKKIALKMDKAICENELNELENFIVSTINNDILFYIFTDISVYYFLKKYNIENKAVYFAKTINCSTYDIKQYNSINIKCLISTELTIDDIINISNLENNFIFTYGYFNILYSKRKLLSLYKNYSNLNYNVKNDKEITNKFYLLEETRNEYYPIIENNNGTFIYAPYAYLLFKEIELINKNNYFYIESIFLTEEDLFKIINIYNQVFKNGVNEELLNEIISINENIGNSFLYLKPEILKEKKNYE